MPFLRGLITAVKVTSLTYKLVVTSTLLAGTLAAIKKPKSDEYTKHKK